MPLITDSEMDDFDAVILKAGFDVNDFHVVDLEAEPTAKEQYPNVGTVTVTRISTGHAKTYRAGYGSAWVVDFLADFYAGKFGQP